MQSTQELHPTFVPFTGPTDFIGGTGAIERTDFTDAAGGTDRSAADSLFSTLYSELHRLAQRELARQSSPQGLGATTLLHEAYLAISDRSGVTFPDRARFMGYASRVMRGLIIDDVRSRLAQKRGGRLEHTTLSAEVAQHVNDPQWLESLSDALDELASHDPTLAELVDLKFFCGFTFTEIAALRGTSVSTVKRNWERSRIYLYSMMENVRTLA